MTTNEFDVTTTPPVRPGFVVEVAALPWCDLCGKAHAHFDFVTDHGPWAYGCEPCYLDARQYTTLGVGKGQRLIVRPERQEPTPGTVGAILESRKARR